MRSFATIAKVVAAIVLALGGAWASTFLWFRIPGGLALHIVASGALAAAFLASIAILLARSDWRAAIAGGAMLGAAIGWFVSIQPRADLDWAPDVSRTVTAEITPSQVTVRDVRNFDWRSDEDFTPRWEDRSYALADLRSVDLINSYWSGRTIAHTLLSFGFADGRYLTFSLEIRRERDEEFSSIAGFFKEYELVVIAADERDIVRLRSNIRHEEVELYRVKASPDQIIGMFRALLERANGVAGMPAFYNSLRTNCTTELFGAARSVAPDLPFDWRIILSGYLPDYVYDQGLVDRRIPFATLREQGRISERARSADADPAFSRRIREGIPDPNI